jgi:cytochrome c oxidase subunit 2
MPLLFLPSCGREDAAIQSGEEQAAGRIPAIDSGASAALLLKTACASCHGLAGEGNRQLGAPSIAGLPAWHVGIQLRKFREGVRGTHARDVAGAQMRAVALSLSDTQISDLGLLVEAMPVHPTVAGDAVAGADTSEGKYLYELECAGCHRYNGHGELAFESAPLTTLPDWYLVRAMEKFAAEVRGYDEKRDPHGYGMRRASRGLTGRQIRDIIGFVASLAEKYPPRAEGEQGADPG